MVRASATELKGHRTRTVAPQDCATQWGNDGLEVLSTPAVLGHTEQLCAELLAPYLGEGEMSVGVTASMNHKAAVPVGAQVRYEVVAAELGGRTEFAFTVSGENGDLVCEGTHLRATIDTQRFLASVRAPGASS